MQAHTGILRGGLSPFTAPMQCLLPRPGERPQAQLHSLLLQEALRVPATSRAADTPPPNAPHPLPSPAFNPGAPDTAAQLRGPQPRRQEPQPPQTPLPAPSSAFLSAPLLAPLSSPRPDPDTHSQGFLLPNGHRAPMTLPPSVSKPLVCPTQRPRALLPPPLGSWTQPGTRQSFQTYLWSTSLFALKNFSAESLLHLAKVTTSLPWTAAAHAHEVPSYGLHTRQRLTDFTQRQPREVHTETLKDNPRSLSLSVTSWGLNPHSLAPEPTHLTMLGAPWN